MHSRERRLSLGIHAEDLRGLLGPLATGVTVVAARHADTGELCGLTASSFASVSLTPPLVLVCVKTSLRSHDAIDTAGAFSVNVLDEHSGHLARRFARSAATDKFRGLRFHAVATGAPVLDAALVWLDCRTYAAHPAGDHTIYVGEVLAGGACEGFPLIRHRGTYARLALSRKLTRTRSPTQLLIG